jgi:WD repeat-containing protein 1 (actin-interacting protein 1)
VFYTGVPFKYAKTIQKHTKFVQSVEFSPTGDLFCSAGSDSKVYLYDGKEGEFKGELSDGSGAHKGTVFAAYWNKGGNLLATSGAGNYSPNN